MIIHSVCFANSLWELTESIEDISCWETLWQVENKNYLRLFEPTLVTAMFDDGYGSFISV